MTLVRRCQSTHSRRPEAGFTLIEVMSALVILAIAMVAVFSTFTTQQKSFTVQNRVVEMQQNLRQAVEYMTRDIRLAGYGIPAPVTLPTGKLPSGTTIRTLFPIDNTAGPDSLYVFYCYDMDGYQPPTTNTSVIAVGAGIVNVAGITGFVTLGGELVLITDNTTADLFETSGAAGTVLTFGGGGYSASAPRSYQAGSTVAKARFVRYYIDTTTDPAHPTLMVDRMAGQLAQPVADDIEDMQLTYGLDTNADGAVDAWITSPNVVTQIPQIRQVRLQLMARSRLPDKDWRETRQALGNHSGGTTTDGYRRRIIDVVIDVRNSGV